VLIDCWATWCAPCVKKFPHLVELHKKYSEQGLVCMSLSLDKLGPEDSYKPEAVVKFLKDKGAEFPNYVIAEPKKDEEGLLKLLGEYSAIPYMAMYDRLGRRIWSSDEKKLTDEQLNKLIEEKLSEKP
jgi:thiol-disulfide isomerase/thioredoxin